MLLNPFVSFPDTGGWAVISGGTKTSSGGYDYHAFTSSGTLTVTTAGDIEYLVVAGGGSGGARQGGGGGGGAVKTGTLTLSNTTNVTVTVGAGGASVTSGSQGNKGSNSSITNGTDSVTAEGGGFGGGRSGTQAGGSGGSGGGSYNGAGGAANDGGGAGGSGPNFNEGGGGGGAAPEAGENAVSNTRGGDGGDGLSVAAFSQFGASGVFGGGGGGGDYSAGTSDPGAAGTGGGGVGGGNNPSQNAGNGTANTGGGGGGAWDNSATASGTSGAGGSGIVVVRVPSTTYTWEAADFSLVADRSVTANTGTTTFTTTDIGTMDEGDYMIVVMGNRGGLSSNPTPPAGWDTLVEENANSAGIYGRFADADDAAGSNSYAFTWTQGGSNDWAWALLLRCVGGVSSVAVEDSDTYVDPTTVSFPNGPNALLNTAQSGFRIDVYVQGGRSHANDQTNSDASLYAYHDTTSFPDGKVYISIASIGGSEPSVNSGNTSTSGSWNGASWLSAELEFTV